MACFPSNIARNWKALKFIVRRVICLLSRGSPVDKVCFASFY